MTREQRAKEIDTLKARIAALRNHPRKRAPLEYQLMKLRCAELAADERYLKRQARAA